MATATPWRPPPSPAAAAWATVSAMPSRRAALRRWLPGGVNTPLVPPLPISRRAVTVDARRRTRARRTTSSTPACSACRPPSSAGPSHPRFDPPWTPPYSPTPPRRVSLYLIFPSRSFMCPSVLPLPPTGLRSQQKLVRVSSNRPVGRQPRAGRGGGAGLRPSAHGRRGGGARHVARRRPRPPARLPRALHPARPPRASRGALRAARARIPAAACPCGTG